VVDAVLSEPVSRSNSLLTGKFTGNFALERAFASSLTAQIGLRPGISRPGNSSKPEI
jgi:hypothetical protein